jgi:hypothetical protein
MAGRKPGNGKPVKIDAVVHKDKRKNIPTEELPDFLARVDDGRGQEDPLNLIVEVSGKRDAEKAAKVATARNLWVPAVNNAGTWGRWAFVEIADPWDAKNAIRTGLQKGKTP